MNIRNKSNKDVGLASQRDPIGKISGFFLFKNLINSYSEDKNSSSEERKNIKKYGVVSLVLSIIALTISLSCLISSLLSLEIAGFSFVLITIVYLVGGVLISILTAIYGFIFGLMQIRLNRKAIGVIGLVLSILSMAASVMLIIFIII